MSEFDSAGATRPPSAGQVGLRRQEPGTVPPESAGPSLNVPQVKAPPKPHGEPATGRGAGDRLAGLPEARGRAESRSSEAELLREDIARTREELGHTVEALAQKADVKSRTRRRIAQTKGRVAIMAHRLRGGTSHPAGVIENRGGRALGMPDMLVDVMARARRRPAVVIAAGVATMAGAGWLDRVQRRSRPGIARRARRRTTRGWSARC